MLIGSYLECVGYVYSLLVWRIPDVMNVQVKKVTASENIHIECNSKNSFIILLILQK